MKHFGIKAGERAEPAIIGDLTAGETSVLRWARVNLSIANKSRLRIKTKLRRGVPTLMLRRAEGWQKLFRNLVRKLEAQ